MGDCGPAEGIMNIYSKAALAIAVLSIAVVLIGNFAWHPESVPAPRIYRSGHYWIKLGGSYVHDPKCPMVMNDIRDGYSGYGQR